MTTETEKKIDLNELEATARAATPGPWKGDRYDGTIKYDLLGKDDETVIHGDNGNSDHGPFGIENEEDEKYLLTFHPETVLALIDQARKAIYADMYQHALSEAKSAGFASVTGAIKAAAGKGWIDLSVEKPKEAQHVLIALATGAVVTGFRFSAGWHWDETDDMADGDAAATHWMPLPDAPAKEAGHV